MTKIESVETYVLRVPLAKPVADSIYYREFWNIPGYRDQDRRRRGRDRVFGRLDR